MGNPFCGKFLVGKPKLPQKGIPLQYFKNLFWTSLIRDNPLKSDFIRVKLPLIFPFLAPACPG